LGHNLVETMGVAPTQNPCEGFSPLRYMRPRTWRKREVSILIPVRGPTG